MVNENFMNDTNKPDARRPLKVRNSLVVQRFARWLSQRHVTPNQISIASVGFAFCAAISFILIPTTGNWNLAILSAVFIQCRLLCNLFDGMVAVEGGKSTVSGELFNDIPDRIADPLIIVSAGYVLPHLDWVVALAWFAGLMSVMTAYVRTLATTIGAPAKFTGPMAKQHRMAVLTVACVLTVFENIWLPAGTFLMVALCVIALGAIVTVVRRSRDAYLALEEPPC